jgi:hypothetical protein
MMILFMCFKEYGFISLFRNVGNGKFDKRRIHLKFDPPWAPGGLKVELKLNFCSYPDKSVDTDVYFIMIDPQGKIYSGMDWNEGLIPAVKNITIPPNVKFSEFTIL